MRSWTVAPRATLPWPRKGQLHSNIKGENGMNNDSLVRRKRLAAFIAAPTPPSRDAPLRNIFAAWPNATAEEKNAILKRYVEIVK